MTVLPGNSLVKPSGLNFCPTEGVYFGEAWVFMVETPRKLKVES